MQKCGMRSWGRIVWGWIGIVVAAIFTLVVSLAIRCDNLPEGWQRVTVVALLATAIMSGMQYFAVRRNRPTYHQYWSRERWSNYLRDIGPFEQKCGQLAIIFTITAWVIYVDMWLNWLQTLADKIGWQSFLTNHLG